MVKPSLASSRPPEPDDENHGMMGFLDHLEELRARLIRSCLAIGAGMVIAFVFRDRIADIVLRPTLKALPEGTSLVATRMGDTFAFYLDIALIGGVIIAAPYVVFQVWRSSRAVPTVPHRRHRVDGPQTGVTGFGSGSFDRIQLKPRTTTRFSRASSNSE